MARPKTTSATRHLAIAAAASALVLAGCSVNPGDATSPVNEYPVVTVTDETTVEVTNTEAAPISPEIAEETAQPVQEVVDDTQTITMIVPADWVVDTAPYQPEGTSTSLASLLSESANQSAQISVLYDTRYNQHDINRIVTDITHDYVSREQGCSAPPPEDYADSYKSGKVSVISCQKTRYVVLVATPTNDNFVFIFESMIEPTEDALTSVTQAAQSLRLVD